MMILPDRRIPKTRLLMPVPNFQWKAPSQSRQKDQFGKEDRTYFALTGRLNDGHIMWRGVFEDRNDADAFLFSMVTGNLLHEPALWRLPTPSWNPALGENLSYQFATITVLTASPGTILTYVKPVDWDNTNNNVQCWAGGAGGGEGNVAGNGRGGGGGGAFSRRYNIVLSGNVSYKIGEAGLGATSVGNGLAGGPTWFVGTDLASSTVGADGGFAPTGQTGGAGGLASNCTGTTNYNGGTAGNGQSGNGAGGGGGGAAGSGAVGGNGTNGASGNGGNGGNGGISDTSVAGGIGATTDGGTGGNGNQYTGGYGSGGGAGGGGGFPSAGGTGGTYGAGGGGGGTSTSIARNGGNGTQGFMIITYEPYVPRVGYNLAMMGM